MTDPDLDEPEFEPLPDENGETDDDYDVVWPSLLDEIEETEDEEKEEEEENG